jgi:hypothetical protein
MSVAKLSSVVANIRQAGTITGHHTEQLMKAVGNVSDRREQTLLGSLRSDVEAGKITIADDARYSYDRSVNRLGRWETFKDGMYPALAIGIAAPVFLYAGPAGHADKRRIPLSVLAGLVTVPLGIISAPFVAVYSAAHALSD